MRLYKTPSIQSKYRPNKKALTLMVVRAFRCSLPCRCEGTIVVTNGSKCETGLKMSLVVEVGLTALSRLPTL